MKKSVRLSVIASLLMGSGAVLAANMGVGSQTATFPVARAYTVPADSSLYQLALQSGISVTELRAMNKGGLDRRDGLKAGESLMLPASSPLFPVGSQEGLIDSNLPELGMGNAPVPKGGPGAGEMKAAGSAQFVGSQDWNNMSGDQAKSQAESWAKGQAKAQVVAPVQKGAQEFLGQFGKAQVSIAVDDKGSLKNSSGSVLTPWYDVDKMVAFSQVGIHGQDGRTIGNVGAGVRVEHGDWMSGYNAFIDQDIGRNHTRGGLGTELWTDNLKLAANYYHPLSDWKDSKDFDDYLERPAEGFDIRAQGYLPAYPQLGASAMYEQYYGDEVALFGKDNLQSDPHAFTVGVDYTPVPLLTLKLSHKEGQDSKSEGKAELMLSYQLGTPLDMQLDPARVATARSMKGSRYDMVDRNYDIVLEYKEKEGLMSLDLAAVPADLLEGDVYVMKPLLRSKYKVTAVSWNGDIVPLAITATAGDNNPDGWRITLPAWDASPGATNSYQLSITVTDENGRQITSNPVTIVVGQGRLGKLQLDGEGSQPASGLNEDAVRLATYLTNHLGEKMTDPSLKPKWIVKDAAGAVVKVVTADTCPTDAGGVVQGCVRQVSTGTEDRDGITYYTDVLVSTIEGDYTVSADLGVYGVTAPQKVTFTLSSVVPAVASAQILDPAGNDILAGNIAPMVGTTYTVKLMNASGDDITSTFPAEQLHWYLAGNASSAGCSVAPVNEDTGVTGTTFTPRTLSSSNSGVACGDQGFGLKVIY